MGKTTDNGNDENGGPASGPAADRSAAPESGPDADSRLWSYVIRTIKPIRREGPTDPDAARALKATPKPSPKPSPKPAKKSTRRTRLWQPGADPGDATRTGEDDFAFMLRQPAGAPSPHTPAPAAAPHAGLDRRTEERLRRGQMDIEAVLDLHGLTVAKAKPRLEEFLLGCQTRGLRCVLVITGKGGRGGTAREDGAPSPLPKPGILRQSLPEWLADAPLARIVLRHAPAKGRHGGSGAFYILLRRIR